MRSIVLALTASLLLIGCDRTPGPLGREALLASGDHRDCRDRLVLREIEENPDQEESAAKLDRPGRRAPSAILI
jgi:hypothetical protein